MSNFPEKSVTKMYGSTLREGVDGCQITRKKGYVTLEWPLSLINRE